MRRPQERRDDDLVSEVRSRLLSMVPGSLRRDIERAARNPVGAVVDLVGLRRRLGNGTCAGSNGHAAVAGGRPVGVVATLHTPANNVAGRLDGILTTVIPIDNDRCRLEASYRGSLDYLAQRLLMLGCEFEVHEPPELSTALRVLSARALRAARDDVDLIWDNS